MQALFIYDNYGTVVTILGGITEVPAGVQGIVATVPQNMKSAYVDLSGDTPMLVFELNPDTESEVTNLQNALVDLELRVSQLEEASR